MFVPEKYHNVWGPQLKAGLAKRDPRSQALDISAGGMLAIDETLTGEARTKVLDYRPSRTWRCTSAAWVLAARTSTTTSRVPYGYEKEAVEVQDLYLDGKKDEAAAALPGEWLELSNLVGPKSYIKERVAAFKEAGVTVLSVNPVGPDAVKQIETAARDRRRLTFTPAGSATCRLHNRTGSAKPFN